MGKSKYSDKTGVYLSGKESDFYQCPKCHAYFTKDDYDNSRTCPHDGETLVKGT